MAPRAEVPADLACEAQCVHFWRGVSGRAYVHSVYSLLECPPIPDASCVFVRREAGRAKALCVGPMRYGAASLNLAKVRHLGACLGAGEVHVHFLPEDPAAAAAIVLDLTAAGLCPQPAEHPQHRSS